MFSLEEYKISHLIKKTIHIGLALIILLSSSGLMINKHFCQNVLVDASFYTEASSCHEGKEAYLAPLRSSNKSGEELDKNNCCKDVSSFLKVETEQQVEFAPDKLPEVDIYSDYHLRSEQYVLIIQAHKKERYKYATPLLVNDIFKDLQSFLC